MALSLRPLQDEGATFLTGHLSAGRNAGLFDKMRVGKTPQTIVTADRLGATSALILCPAHAKVKWHRELEAWEDIIRDAKIVNSTKAKIPDAETLIVNYELLAYRSVKDQLMARRFDLMVGDEIQFMKNRRSRRTRAVLGPKSDKRNGLMSVCGGFIPLSGTPKPNYPDELWPWLHAGMPEIIDHMDYQTFMRRYCLLRETHFGLKIIGGQNLEELRDRLKQRFLRRSRKDAGISEPQVSLLPLETKDLKGLRELNDHPDNFLFEQAYASEGKLVTIKDEDAEKTEYEIEQTTLLRLLAVLKAAPLADILKYELENGMEKVVVFAIHTEAIEKLTAELRDFGAVSIYGKTARGQRQQNIDRFQNDPDCRVIVGHIISMGSAITLDAADDIVFLERSWVPGDNDQAAARCDAVGKETQVSVRTCYLVGSVDEKVHKAERQKNNIDKRTFGD